jgi:hypothetical protein
MTQPPHFGQRDGYHETEGAWALPLPPWIGRKVERWLALLPNGTLTLQIQEGRVVQAERREVDRPRSR